MGHEVLGGEHGEVAGKKTRQKNDRIDAEDRVRQGKWRQPLRRETCFAGDERGHFAKRALAPHAFPVRPDPLNDEKIAAVQNPMEHAVNRGE